MSTNGRKSGRLVFPVLGTLISEARKPFPLLSFMLGQCPGCKAPGMGYVVLQGRLTGGMSAVHDRTCPLAVAHPA